ncbi:MAG: hypothetical protein ACFE0J_12220 [Elainellaceae cyanobacterium]
MTSNWTPKRGTLSGVNREHVTFANLPSSPNPFSQAGEGEPD